MQDATNKSIVEEAYPGDVVGLYDSGNFKIGRHAFRRRIFAF